MVDIQQQLNRVSRSLVVDSAEDPVVGGNIESSSGASEAR